MHDWPTALRIFVIGFSGVFVTLALLMVSILISGSIVKTAKKLVAEE